MPTIGPANRMKFGQRSPSSNDSTVPDTAPTANRIAAPFDQRLARSRYSASPVRIHRHSAMTMRSGKPIPITEKMMWKASDIAIWLRAASRSDIGTWAGAAASGNAIYDVIKRQARGHPARRAGIDWLVVISSRGCPPSRGQMTDPQRPDRGASTGTLRILRFAQDDNWR